MIYIAPSEMFAAGGIVELVSEVAVLAVEEEVDEDG
jgi:hypothetical protein